MPAVFVHGNPETAAIWSDLLPKLSRNDLVTLSPPGFGAATPAGWGATRQEYRDWLIAELEAIGEPVDLVGHDWGGGHVAAVAMARPDLLRTWTIDVMGLFHPDYEWHEAAQGWQTAGVGEEMVQGMLGAPLAEGVAGFVAVGMSEAIATQVLSNLDADTGRCILALYRDAAQPAMRQVGADLSGMRQRPGLVVQAENDHYCGTADMIRETAVRAGAQVSELKGVGHWWMIEDPAAGARMLDDFWASV